MLKKFNELPKIAQILLLIIPFVNFVMELIIRVSLYQEKNSNGNLIMLILGIISAGFIGFVDAIFIILKGEILTLD